MRLTSTKGASRSSALPLFACKWWFFRRRLGGERGAFLLGSCWVSRAVRRGAEHGTDRGARQQGPGASGSSEPAQAGAAAGGACPYPGGPRAAAPTRRHTCPCLGCCTLGWGDRGRP